MQKVTALDNKNGNVGSFENWNIFEFVINLFFPKDYFDTYLQGFEKFENSIKLRKPDFENAFFDQIVVCSDYKKLEKLLHRAKFNGEISIVSDFAKIMSICLKKAISQNLILEPDLLIFVPPDAKRLGIRGFHLPQILTQKVSQKTKIPFVKILKKTKQTQAQTQLNREKRLVNLENSFELIGEISPKIKTVCLIDDICTTGSTLNECVRILKQNYPYLQVFALVLASN